MSEWDFLGPRVVMVSPFPPARDGIARYAEQLVDALRADREVVRVGTADGGGGDYVLPLRGGLGALRLLRFARRGDDLVVQFHPHYFHLRGHEWGDRRRSLLAWLAVVALRRVTFVVHELDDPLPDDLGRRGRAYFALEERLRRLLWRRAANVVVHSEAQRRDFRARFPGGRRRADRIVTHGAFFASSIDATPAQARERLGLPADRVLLLCIGFLSPGRPDKGFDRAIAAVRDAAVPEVELHIVGSPIRPGPDVDAFVADLRARAAAVEAVHLHERYVSDEEFDLWIRAADAVLTPYRTGSSSGVVERAHLLGTPLVTSGAGGLAEQLRDADVLIETDEDLRRAVVSVARRVQSSAT